MKYQEIKKRLDKCQVSLELLQTKQATVTASSNTNNSKRTKTAIKVLKESIKIYKKILSEGEESYLLTPKGGKPTLAKLSSAEVDALKDSDDVDKIKTASGDEVKESNLLTKNSGVEFSLEETKDIAKLVGKALAKTLKKAGDELSKMKAHRIDVNSFDIYVEYKKDVNVDDFSFYIANDKLHIVDFTFNKELVEVGVKPSGEGIINIDVLSNELLKHFKSLSEGGDYDPDQMQKDDEEDHGVGYDDEGRPLGEGEGDDHHYIKVTRSDYKPAMAILNDNIDPTYVKMDVVDNDGAGNVIIYFMFRHEDGFDDMYDDSENPDSEFYQEPEENPNAFMYDMVMDLAARGVDVIESSHSDDVDEAMDINDPVMLKVRRAKMHSDKMKQLDDYSKSPEGRAAARSFASSERKESKAREVVRKLKIKRAQVMSDMENDPEIESTGGPVSDMYGDQLNKIDNAIEKAASVYSKPMSYDTAVGKVSESEMHSTFEDYIAKLEERVYVERLSDGRIFIHPLDKPGVNRPSRNYIIIDGNNITSIQGYDSGPIEDLAKKYYLEVGTSQLTPMGKINARGRVSLLSTNILVDAIKAIKDSRDVESKKQSDYYKNRGPVSGVGNMDESKIPLKEFTDNSFLGSEIIDMANDNAPDMFGKQIFADLLPKGVASENDAFEALKAHDKSPIKARMGRYAPMFVHVQYHNLEHEGEKYRMHQTQYYNSNFKDKDPNFNPGVSRISLDKVDENDEGQSLGMILVKTDEYVQDLRNIPGLGRRVSEVVNELDDNKSKALVKKAVADINGAMFKFRHSNPLKMIAAKDKDLKVKLDSMHNAIFDLEKVLKAKDLFEATRQDLGMISSVSKRRARAELKQKLAGKRSDGMGKYDGNIYGLDNDGKRVELKSLNDLNKFKKFELDADIYEANNNLAEGKPLNEFVGKELEDRNEALYDDLVPGDGKADTVQGEMLRAINRIVYRYYNDGDEYHTGYGTETAGPAHSYLVNANHPLRSLVSTLFKDGTNYEQTIKDVLDAILDHIESRRGKYAPNSEDMFDYEPEFEDNEFEEDDYDDYYDDYDEFDNEEQYQNEDLDVGHQDDEPKMIQKELYDIAQYASKLFKRLKKYDSMEDEVDFPHWWQKKVTLAREYISSANHYLEGEEEAQLSGKLTLENLVSEYGGSASRNLDEIFGALGYRQGFDEFIEDNPGCVEAIMEWIGSIRDFQQKLSQEYSNEELENLGFYFGDDEIYESKNLLKQDALSPAEYQKAKKLKGFDAKNYKWDAKQELHLIRKMYEAKGGQIMPGDYVKNQHGNIYQRVDGKVGKHDAYVRVTNGKAGKKKTGLHDSFKLTLVNKDDIKEAGPGFKHDCAAKVIHKEHGAGNCIPEKHTLVKEGKKYIVTHYDVLFESGKTVTDIPVRELDIKTTNEHWHKGYKKKKK